MTSTQKGSEEVWKFVIFLQILLFLNNRSIVHFFGWGVGAGSMIPNVKKVMFLALVPVLR